MIKQAFNLNAKCYKDYVSSVCVQSYSRSDTVYSVLYTINHSRYTVCVPQVSQWHDASVYTDVIQIKWNMLCGS